MVSGGGVCLEALCRCDGLKKSHKVLCEGPAWLLLGRRDCCTSDPSSGDLPEGGSSCSDCACNVVPRPLPPACTLLRCRLRSSCLPASDARVPLPSLHVLVRQCAAASPAAGSADAAYCRSSNVLWYLLNPRGQTAAATAGFSRMCMRIIRSTDCRYASASSRPPRPRVRLS